MTPVEFYLGFDKDFFHPDRWDTVGEAAEAELRQTAERYTRLLRSNQLVLGAVLENNARPEDLSKEFYHELESLVGLERFEFAKIRKEFDSIPFLIKADDLAKEAGVQLTEAQEWYVCGRIVAHICRLMMPKEYYWKDAELVSKARNDYCSRFAKDYLRYSASRGGGDYELQCESDTLRQNIGIEGEGTFVFWTIAPYVHLDIQQRGKTQMESIERIFKWAEQSNCNVLQHAYFWHLDAYITSKPLGFDERMPTHVRARLCSKIVGRELA